MKLVSKISISFILIAVLLQSGIHNYSISKIEGGSKSLGDYQGKKILVITLPVQQTASTDSLLFSLDSLAVANANVLAVVAVPSYEDGYTAGIKDSLLQRYRTKLTSAVLITDAMYTRKTSGQQQHELFQWLTKSSANGTFDIDCEGSGMKFFADAQGRLYSVLQPQAKINGRSVQRTLALQ